MIIRICTEYKNHERVRELCAKRFDAFTIYYGMGAWKGVPEPSMTIEIAAIGGDGIDRVVQESLYRTKAHELAILIKELNDQEAILVEYIESTNVLI
jgi:hypothetical protein